MKPRSLFEALNTYQGMWFEEFNNPFQEEIDNLERFKTLLLKTEAPFSRNQYPGHLTGSCFVVNPSQSEILLLHHRKLEKWLQMGGHCDGEIEMSQVALREAEEESGSRAIDLLFPWIIDLDIHLIPSRKIEPEHYHYDVRYLGVCRSPEQIKLDESESTDLAWFSWKRAFQIAQEPSMHRVFKKVEFLQSKVL
ncbi:MAG: NUDIX hydrolase [Pseudomonadota bacterium]